MAQVYMSLVKKGELQSNWARMNSLTEDQSGLSAKYQDDLEEQKAWLQSGAFMEERKIKNLLPLLRPTACQDPRDKVLALLGIAHDRGRGEGHEEC